MQTPVTNPETHFETRFELKDVLKNLLGTLGLFALFTGLLSLAPQVSEILTPWPQYARFLVAYFIQFIVLFAPFWFMVVAPYHTEWKDFGFIPVPSRTLIRNVVSNFAIYLGLATLLLSLAASLHYSIPGYQTQSSYVPLFGNNLTGWILGFIIVGFVAPFLEEWWFRGFLYPTLKKSWGEALGTLVSAALFAGVHFQFQNILQLFILGLLLNRCVKNSGSTWTSFTLHALNNLLAFGLQVYFATHPELLQNLNF